MVIMSDVKTTKKVVATAPKSAGIIHFTLPKLPIYTLAK